MMYEKPTLGVVMDPIHHINPYKDTTLALLLAAQQQGFELYYLELEDLFLQYGIPWGYAKTLKVFPDMDHWFQLTQPQNYPLDRFDVLLMRKDPPVNLAYWYATYILEHAEQNGVLVLNKPQSLRDANEKLFATWFPQCMPPSIVSCSTDLIRQFVQEHTIAVLKPLDSMGGQNVFKCHAEDPNLSGLIQLLTNNQTQFIMVQRFIPEISQGDKRVLLIDGEPIPFGLARIPAAHNFKGNLAAGATGIGIELSERDLWICDQVGPILKEKGLAFVGIDIIGDYLTEINVTSPTGVRELEKAFDINIASHMIKWIIKKLER